ncbi:hypothetical protein OG21DRAFT_1390719, partial [Imleria badia]
VAAGGLIYTLLLVAGMDLKSVITRSSITIAWEVGKMLRDPNCIRPGEWSHLYLAP